VIPLYDDNPTRRKPVVTLLLIAANVVVFLFVQPHSGQREVDFLFRNAAIPCEVTSGHPVEEVRGQPTCDLPEQRPVFPEKNVYVAVLVAMFLHANLIHIFGNMLFLWIFGNNIEDEMGPLFFVLFYLVCGIAAAGAHIALFPHSATPVIGASGAIAGVMGAYLVRFPRARVLTVLPILLFIPFWLPAWVVLLAFFVEQFFISAVNSGVATAAHIGGFATGALRGLIFLRHRRPRQPQPLTPAWRSGWGSGWRPGY